MVEYEMHLPFIMLSQMYVQIGKISLEASAKDFKRGKGPYLNDVYTIFGIFDPLPPCLHFGKIHTTKSTQPPLLCLHFVNPLPPLSVDVI